MIAVGDVVRWRKLGSAALARWEVQRTEGAYVWLRDLHTGATQVACPGDCEKVGRMADRIQGDIVSWLFPWKDWREEPISGAIFARRGRNVVFALRDPDGTWRLPGHDRMTVEAWTPLAL